MKWYDSSSKVEVMIVGEIEVDMYQMIGDVVAKSRVLGFFVILYSIRMLISSQITLMAFSMKSESEMFVKKDWKNGYVQVWLHLILVKGLSSVMNLEFVMYSNESL
jgi:hypothetical protein